MEKCRKISVQGLDRWPVENRASCSCRSLECGSQDPHCNSSSPGSDSLFRPLRAPAFTCTYPHLINNEKENSLVRCGGYTSVILAFGRLRQKPTWATWWTLTQNITSVPQLDFWGEAVRALVKMVLWQCGQLWPQACCIAESRLEFLVLLPLSSQC